MQAVIIRLSSAGPLFRSGGFELDQSWRGFDSEKLTGEQIETLRARVGRWIQIYPEDVGALEALLAVEADTTPVAQTPEDTTPAAEADTKAAKARKKG